MRTNIIRICICIGKFFLNIIYFFMKLFPSKNKLVMLSRQSDRVNIDFEYIKNEILKRDNTVKVKILCKIIRKNPIERLKYCSYILVSMYHIATAKVCILDGYSIPISILKHKKNLEIIQIWHASGAIKKFGYQAVNKKEGRGIKIAKIMRMHRNYSHVFAPSIVTSKIYEEAFDIKEEQIVISCLPRIDYILDDNITKLKREEFYNNEKYKGKKTILYVPTFRKEADNKEIIKGIINSVNHNKYNLIIKLHPLDRTKDISKYFANPKYNTFDLLKIADYIITDYSATAFEASVLQKPLYFYVHDIEEYEKLRGLNVELYKEMNNSTSKNIKEIIMSIENEEYDFEQLNNFKTKYMGTSYYNNTEKIVDFIYKYLNKEIKHEDKNNTNEHSKEKLNI